MMIKHLLLILTIFSSLTLLAQTRTVRGVITSSEDNTGLPGVNILVKGTTRGTVTDIDGNYALSGLSDSDVLVFSFIGFIPIEEPVNGKTIIDLAMLPDYTKLEEVVVTGYGATLKREVTGAIGSVKGDVVKDVPVQSAQSLIQGRISGVLVQADNGIPGGGISLIVRGASSINAGNLPLYIVDGVQINIDDNSFTSGNPLAFINPADIESIEVLKDAASTAKYGSKAANGVVLITTKSGKEGKTQFTFNTYMGFNERIKELDVLNSQELIQFRLEQYERSERLFGRSNPLGAARIFALRSSGLDLTEYGVTNFTRDFAAQAEQIPQAEFDALVNSLETYDWGNALQRQGMLQNHQLSASGGSENTTYYVSGSFNRTEAPVRGTNFERITFRSNFQHKASERLSFGSNLSLSNTTQETDFSGGFFFTNPIFGEPFILPWNPIFDAETGDYNEPLLGTNRDNPIKSIDLNDISTVTNQVVGNFHASYEIFDFLSYRGTVGLDYRELRDNFFLDPRTVFGATVNGRGIVRNSRNSNVITTQQLNFSKTINEDHKVSGLAVFEYRHEQFTGSNLQGENFPNELFRTVQSAAEPINVSSFTSEYKTAGFLLNGKYSFKDRYYIDLSVRRDGSSRLGLNNQWGTFPSASASWRISEESFFNVGVIQELKLRAGWGVNGNDQINGNFAARTLFSGGGAYNGQPAIFFSGLGNSDLKWEGKEEFNIGLDFELFAGRLSGSIDAYNNTPDNLILSAPLPGYAGAGGSVFRNVGKLRNRGLEISLNSVNFDVGGFKWSTNFNIAFQDTKVLELIDGRQNISFDVQVGEPLFLWYTFEYAGVNPANGRPMWYDRDGNITYQPSAGSDVGADDDDRRKQGSIFNDYFGGLTNQLSYKGFTLSAFFSYEFGKTGVESVQFYSYNPRNPFDLDSNKERDLVNQVWRQPGDIARWAAPSAEGFPNTLGARGGSAALQDLSYIRLKTLTLSYNIPETYLSKAGIGNVRIYAQGTNLFTATAFTGIDPEFTGASNRSRFPLNKVYTFGLDVNF